MNKRLSSNKRVNEVIKLASQAGWKVEKRGSGHISLYPPSKDGEIITLPSSPSSTRNWKNMLSKLRKNGLNV